MADLQTAISFNNETVALDGETFSDCEFRACRMVYAGGAPPNFTDCKFSDCDWKFSDGGADTLAFLKILWGVGGKAPVQALIKEITGGGGR